MRRREDTEKKKQGWKNKKKMEETGNKAALDRALAPPFRPEGRRPVFRFVNILFNLKIHF